MPEHRIGGYIPQSLAQIYLHIVFSTKQRQPLLSDDQLRKKMHACIAVTCRNLESECCIVGGTEDHVHLLVRHSRNSTVANLVKELKRVSSKWIKTLDFLNLLSFQWQSGYGAFSISPSHVDTLRVYVANQENHHRKVSYQDEFRKLCTTYGIKMDERYAWE